MNINQVVKKNVSGMHVIKTLQLLLEDNYTMAQLVEKLNNSETDAKFNNSVVSKYINTCRMCGIEIHKIHNKYFVAHLPFGLDLSTREIELLSMLQNVAEKEFSLKIKETFFDFMNRISKYSNKHMVKVEKDNVEKVEELFYRAIQEKRKVSLMYKNKKMIECVPLEIIEKNGKTFFKVSYKNKEKDIYFERISGVEIIDKNFILATQEPEKIVFRLYGALAQRYTLKENEEEVGRSAMGYITISNKCENRAALMARILRYDSCCEVVSPQDFRDEVKRTLKDMLANYGVE